MEKCGLELMLHVTDLAGLRQWCAWAAGGAGRAASLPDGVALRISRHRPLVCFYPLRSLSQLAQSSLFECVEITSPIIPVLNLHCHNGTLSSYGTLLSPSSPPDLGGTHEPLNHFESKLS